MGSEYPLATDGLSKGSIVSAAEIEHAFNIKRGSSKYQLACMALAKHITDRFAERGQDVFVIYDKDNIRILTDEEAVPYAAKRFRSGIKAAYVAHVKQLGADRSKMSEGTRAIHDRNLQRQGAILQAIRREEQTFRLRATERQTPGLPDTGKKI